MNFPRTVLLTIAILTTVFAIEVNAQGRQPRRPNSPRFDQPKNQDNSDRGDFRRGPQSRNQRGGRPQDDSKGPQSNRGPRPIEPRNAGESNDSRQSKRPNDRKPRKKKGHGSPASNIGDKHRLPEIVPQQVRVPSYTDVFNSIPFSRAIHDNDPSYRHNATMELLLGQLRPQTIYNAPTIAPQGYMPGYGMQTGYRGQRPGFNYFVIPGAPFVTNSPGLQGRISINP
jgi:hypothetical protein